MRQRKEPGNAKCGRPMESGTYPHYSQWNVILRSILTVIAFSFPSDKNPEFMHDQCQLSCGLCTPADCLDLAEAGTRQCREWAWHGEWYV